MVCQYGWLLVLCNFENPDRPSKTGITAAQSILCASFCRIAYPMPHAKRDVKISSPTLIMPCSTEPHRISLHVFILHIFQINVGLIHRVKGVLKTVREKQLPISVPAGADAPCVLAEAVRKHTAYNHVDSEDVYHLLYPSFLEVITLPGT